MTKQILLLVAISFALASCHATKHSETNESEKTQTVKDTSLQSVTKIPYEIAQNYFVKNDYPNKEIHTIKITSQQELDKVFGMATTMRKDGAPTSIDFSRDYVIACIDKESNRNAKIDILKLYKNAENIVLSYNINEYNVQSFSTRDVVLLIVNKQYQGNIILNQIR